MNTISFSSTCTGGRATAGALSTRLTVALSPQRCTSYTWTASMARSMRRWRRRTACASSAFFSSWVYKLVSNLCTARSRCLSGPNRQAPCLWTNAGAPSAELETVCNSLSKVKFAGDEFDGLPPVAFTKLLPTANELTDCMLSNYCTYTPTHDKHSRTSTQWNKLSSDSKWVWRALWRQLKRAPWRHRSESRFQERHANDRVLCSCSQLWAEIVLAELNVRCSNERLKTYANKPISVYICFQWSAIGCHFRVHIICVLHYKLNFCLLPVLPSLISLILHHALR